MDKKLRGTNLRLPFDAKVMLNLFSDKRLT